VGSRETQWTGFVKDIQSVNAIVSLTTGEVTFETADGDLKTS
jgi:hypothetical protein